MYKVAYLLLLEKTQIWVLLDNMPFGEGTVASLKTQMEFPKTQILQKVVLVLVLLHFVSHKSGLWSHCVLLLWCFVRVLASSETQNVSASITLFAHTH